MKTKNQPSKNITLAHRKNGQKELVNFPKKFEFELSIQGRKLLIDFQTASPKNKSIVVVSRKVTKRFVDGFTNVSDLYKVVEATLFGQYFMENFHTACDKCEQDEYPDLDAIVDMTLFCYEASFAEIFCTSK